jgi:hypothetical protein
MRLGGGRAGTMAHAASGQSSDADRACICLRVAVIYNTNAETHPNSHQTKAGSRGKTEVWLILLKTHFMFDFNFCERKSSKAKRCWKSTFGKP